MALILFSLLGYFVVKNIHIDPKLISPISVGNLIGINALPPPDSSNLTETIDKILTGAKGTYGIVVKNLKTGESYAFNEHTVFEPASLYKIWIMGTVYEQIEDGSLKEDQTLSQNIVALNSKFDIDPKHAEQTKGTISLTVAKALEQMITISHNYAALLLSEKIRLSKVEDFLIKHGFGESALGQPPKSTPYDIANFFEKLYQGELASPENTQKMLEYLKGQKLNKKLPKYLAKEVVIAHKTGELGSFSHDAGIVYLPSGDYLIVVMTKSDSPISADERIAEISKEVFEYFKNK